MRRMRPFRPGTRPQSPTVAVMAALVVVAAALAAWSHAWASAVTAASAVYGVAVQHGRRSRP
ncbi:hypothetical protein ABZW47_16270 [Streptomyces sp. NPDC004549]|uniref:hypothetical protein n=1 Tax=Streptomyces sp. NPDC004549 TaxID=3154283 RepID=UPI0033BF2878